MSTLDKNRRALAVRCVETGEVFPTITAAAAAKHSTFATIKRHALDERCTDWEAVGAWKDGDRGTWSSEEVALLRAHLGEPLIEIYALFPGRSHLAVANRRYRERLRRGEVDFRGEACVDPRRPPTYETAYLCRIDYRDKRRLGYTREQAIRWISEADSRAVDIVEDLLFNHAYDADVARLARANSANLHQGRGHGVKFWEEMMGCSRETD